MTVRTWFITGAGRGLGRSFVEAALERGDRVVGTARKTDELDALFEPYGDQALALQLDVADRPSVYAAVASAIEAMGHLDVVLNNAGYGLAGAIEEVTEAQARAQLDVNFFGALWVTQAVLPHLRSRRSGHIVQISSISAVESGKNFGMYCASKAALEAMSESLAREVEGFGIRVTIVQPSRFRTDWAGSSLERAAPNPAYDEALESSRRKYAEGNPIDAAPGAPALAAQRVVELIENDDPPLRLLLGNVAVDIAAATYDGRLRSLATWEQVSRSADS